MAISEQRVRALLLQEAERIVVPPELRTRLDARLRAPNSTRTRILALATAAVLVVIVGIAGSVIASDSLSRPAKPAASTNGAESPTSSLPVPGDVHITPPARGLARELAAFSGTWQGNWDGGLPSRLIVERITSTSAQVVYVWGTSQYVPTPGWGRPTAQVLPDGRLTWERVGVFPSVNASCDPSSASCSSVRFTFTMGADHQTIRGTRQVTMASSGYINTVTMRRVGGSSGRRYKPIWLAIIAVVLLSFAAIVVRRKVGVR
jgi:hypothetical protein